MIEYQYCIVLRLLCSFCMGIDLPWQTMNDIMMCKILSESIIVVRIIIYDKEEVRAQNNKDMLCL